MDITRVGILCSTPLFCIFWDLQERPEVPWKKGCSGKVFGRLSVWWEISAHNTTSALRAENTEEQQRNNQTSALYDSHI